MTDVNLPVLLTRSVTVLLHGLYRSLVANMVKGVTEGYKKELELVGVGFKAANQVICLDLALGYSHNIIFEIPKELKVATDTGKRSEPKDHFGRY